MEEAGRGVTEMEGLGAKYFWQCQVFPESQYHTNIGIREYWYLLIFGGWGLG